MNRYRYSVIEKTTPPNTDSGQRTVVLVVAELLAAASIDQITRYGEISRVAACNVQENRNRWIVLAALDHLNRTRGLVYACERGAGYRRLSSESGVKHAGERGIKRVRSATKNGQRRLENAVARANDLSPPEQRVANQRLATFGLIEHLTKAKTVKTIPADGEVAAPVDALSGLRRALGLK